MVVDRNFSSSKASTRQASGPAIIEVVIVVDKEFGDLFSSNYQRIVDYLTVYFWDLNIRYKTLPSVDISFRVNGLLIMDVCMPPFVFNYCGIFWACHLICINPTLDAYFRRYGFPC